MQSIQQEGPALCCGDLAAGHLLSQWQRKQMCIIKSITTGLSQVVEGGVKVNVMLVMVFFYRMICISSLAYIYLSTIRWSWEVVKPLVVLIYASMSFTFHLTWGSITPFKALTCTAPYTVAQCVEHSGILQVGETHTRHKNTTSLKHQRPGYEYLYMFSSQYLSNKF